MQKLVPQKRIAIAVEGVPVGVRYVVERAAHLNLYAVCRVAVVIAHVGLYEGSGFSISFGAAVFKPALCVQCCHAAGAC